MAGKILRMFLCLWLLWASDALQAAPAGVVARVGTIEISTTELDEAVEQAVNSGYYHKDLPDPVAFELRKKELRSLIRQRLDYLGAVDHGLQLENGRAEAQRAEIERQLGEEEYRRSLSAKGWTLEDHRRVIERTLLARKAHQRFITEKARVSDAELLAAWESDPGRWVMPPSLHLLHILLKVDPTASVETWRKRRHEAEAIRQRAMSGEDFKALASEFSEDMYRIRGGDLGWVHQGRLLRVLEEPVWAADTGEVVGPLRSREGFHLIKVLGRQPEKKLSFEEVKPMLRKEAEEQARSRAEERWYGEVSSGHPVVILAPELADIEV